MQQPQHFLVALAAALAAMPGDGAAQEFLSCRSGQDAIARGAFSTALSHLTRCLETDGLPIRSAAAALHLRAMAHAAGLLERDVCDRALVLAVEIFEECADLYARAPRLLGRPLVEAAGCLWLERGHGELGVESGRGPRRSAPGEMLSCGPLADLADWRRGAQAGPLELSGWWRGETARLAWIEPPAGESAA